MSTDSFNAILLNRTCQNRSRAGISWPRRSRARQRPTAACLLSGGSSWGTPSPAGATLQRAPPRRQERGKDARSLRSCWGRWEPIPAESQGHGAAQQRRPGRGCSAPCQLRFGAGTEVIRCFCGAVFQPPSYLQRSYRELLVSRVRVSRLRAALHPTFSSFAGRRLRRIFYLSPG